MTSNRRRIAVIGLGQIGGSLASALGTASVPRTASALEAGGDRRRDDGTVSVTGYDRDPAVTAEALRRGVIDKDARSPSACADGADIVVLAVPVREIIRLIPDVAGVMLPGSVLLDTGSTKRSVVDAMNACPGEARCFGGHPIAGDEKSGADSWDGRLFLRKTYVVTPTTSSDAVSRSEVEWLVTTIGAHSHSMDAAEHDRVMAATSHLPLLLAGGLVELAGMTTPNMEQLGDLIGGSFLSATRVTQKPAAMTTDILFTNHDQLSDAYDVFDRKMRRALGVLRENPDVFASKLSELRDMRRHIVSGDKS